MDAEKIGGTLFVGQDNARELIHVWSTNNSFPHFVLIAGQVGSGRKLLSFLFAKELGAEVSIVSDISVDNIREVVEASYSVDSKIVYLIPDADKMSLAAKNSLLKFTEEPPTNAYIIMTLLSVENTLHTLQSRSQHITTVPYTLRELKQLSDDDRLCRIATTPGMLKRLTAMPKEDVDKLVDVANKIINYIDKVSLPNALKSASAIKFKEADKGIDLDLVLATMTYLIDESIRSQMDCPQLVSISRLACWTRSLAEWARKFSYSAVNKRAVYDQFIIAVRDRLHRLEV